MKTQLLTLIFIVFAFSISNAQSQSGWEWLNPIPSSNWRNSVKFINDSTGFIVGSTEEILKTTDYGMSWTIMNCNSGLSGNFTDLFFTDSNSIYVVSSNGKIFKSIDAGNNWTVIYNNSEFSLNGIYFTDFNTGYVVGNSGLILKTINAGANWTSSFTSWSIESITFVDDSVGYAAGSGGSIIKTVDAGNNWTTLNSGVYNNLNSITYLNNQIIYSVGDGGKILKSSDAGLTWNSQTSGTSSDLSSIFFIDSVKGFISGNGGKILKTSNGGITWSLISVGSSNSTYDSVYFTDSLNGYIVGSGMFKTNDGGITWINLLSGVGINGSINSAFFIDDTTCYIVTYESLLSKVKICKSIDAGENWSLKTIGISSRLNSIYFYDSVKGYAVSDIGHLVKTIDGGNNWTISVIASFVKLKSVFFTKNNIGFAVGENGSILKSIDEGLTWETINVTTNTLNSVYFTDSLNGLIVGNNGTILKTINGGENWSQINSGTNYHLFSCYFTNDTVGYIAGEYGKILKTIDSGFNWFQLSSGTTYSLKSVFFENEDIGYITGEYGIILKTNNSGASWDIQISGTSTFFTTISFTDFNTGYIFSEGGIIKKTHTGGVYVEQSIDSLRALTVQNNSQNNFCQIPYQSEILVNTMISGPSYNVGDSINYHLWFGDGSDTTFTKTVEHIPSYIASYTNHTYQLPGVFSVKCKVTALDGRTDSLIVNDLIIVSDTCGNITGTVYKDINANCIVNSNETKVSNRKVSLFHNSQLIALTYTNSNGVYSFDVPDNTDYTVVLDTTNLLGYTLLCPANANYTVNSFPSINQDFALYCGMGYDFVPYLAGFAFRPGFDGYLQLNIKNYSCNPYSGNISVKLDSLTSFNNSYPAPAQIIGDSLVWNFTNLTNQQDIHIPISLYTSTSAWVSNTVCFTVTVAPVAGDNDTSNNVQQYCFPIVNSWDPNEKEVSPQGQLSGDTTLTYTIHFQNTGNAEAYNIFILDTIDSNLDLSSLRIISYSHPMTINVINEQPKTILKFNFQDIMLPDSGTNNLQSMGYVTYSLRTKTGLPHGTSIKNTAYIYFDFNPAIVTNTVESKIIITGIAKVKPMIDVTLYPNPTNDKIYIQSQENLNVRVYNLLGTNIYTGKTIDCNFVNLSQKGIYLFELSNEKGMVYKKVVVQ